MNRLSWISAINGERAVAATARRTRLWVFAANIAERISVKAGVWLLLPLVTVGIGSVLYWHFSELRTTGVTCAGAWRYGIIRCWRSCSSPFFSHPGIPGAHVFGVLALYALSKAFELLDASAFALGHIVSGHTLKHLQQP